MSDKIVGILGGMGPEATAQFLKKIVEHTPAEKDQDHLRLFLDHNPKIPDRTQAILGRGESPLSLMKEGLKNLQKLGADLIAIPCNSAHYFLEELQPATTVPIVDMVEEVVSETRHRVPGIKRVGLMATTGTVQGDIYRERFSAYKISLITPNGAEQKSVMRSIDQIKGGLRTSKIATELRAIARGLVDRGAEAIILGCTELSLVGEDWALNVPVIDSLDVLARVVVRRSKD